MGSWTIDFRSIYGQFPGQTRPYPPRGSESSIPLPARETQEPEAVPLGHRRIISISNQYGEYLKSLHLLTAKYSGMFPICLVNNKQILSLLFTTRDIIKFRKQPPNSWLLAGFYLDLYSH